VINPGNIVEYSRFYLHGR